MTIQIDETTKALLKEQRLRILASQWYEQELNRVAYDANNKVQQAAEAARIQGEIEASYKAIEAME